jgi:hypothetical protein
MLCEINRTEILEDRIVEYYNGMAIVYFFGTVFLRKPEQLLLNF